MTRQAIGWAHGGYGSVVHQAKVQEAQWQYQAVHGSRCDAQLSRSQDGCNPESGELGCGLWRSAIMTPHSHGPGCDPKIQPDPFIRFPRE